MTNLSGTNLNNGAAVGPQGEGMESPSTFPKYPAYKNSGSDRLGDVPSHWEVVPCRAIVDECVEKNDLVKVTEYLSLMANIGIIRYEDKGDVGNKKPDD